MTKEKNFRAYLAWMAVCFFWGTTYLAIRIGVKELPAALFCGLRFLIAGPILFVILIFRGYSLPKKEEWIHLAIMGLTLLGMGTGLLTFAEEYIPSGLSALLVTTVPFWIVGIDSLLPHGKRFNLKILGGLLFGFAGVGLIFGLDLKSLFDQNYLTGVIGLMIGVIGWSGGTVYSKYKKVSVHPLMGAAIQMITAGIVLILLAGVLGEFSKFTISSGSLFALAYLVVFGSLVGFVSYVYAIAHLPVSFVSTYAYINPVIALFLGWLVLGEVISFNIIIAAIIILAGVVLVKKGSET